MVVTPRAADDYILRPDQQRRQEFRRRTSPNTTPDDAARIQKEVETKYPDAGTLPSTKTPASKTDTGASPLSPSISSSSSEGVSATRPGTANKQQLDFETEIRTDPALHEDRIIELPPDQLIEQAGNRANSSEGTTDIFYKIYAERLQKITDSKTPSVRELRRRLVESLQLLNELKTGAGGKNGHESARIPADVEWMLYSDLFRNDGFFTPLEYTLEDAQLLATIVIKPFVDGAPPEKRERVAKELKSAFKQIRRGEAAVPEELRSYFRHRIMYYLARQIF